MQLRGSIDPDAAPSNRSETLRLVPSETIAQTAFVPMNVARSPKRSFRKRAKAPASDRQTHRARCAAPLLRPDLGDSWEHADNPQCSEKFSALGMRIAINYVIYEMTH